MSEPYGQQPPPGQQQFAPPPSTSSGSPFGPPQYGPPLQAQTYPPPPGGASSYQPQPYQPQPYQPQPTGPQPHATAPARSATLNVVGLVLIGLGAVGVLLAFTVLDWFRSDRNTFFSGANGDSTFSKLHTGISRAKSGLSAAESKQISFGVADLYFGWLGWVLFGGAVLFGALALVPALASTPAVKLLAALVALAAIGLTAWAVDLVRVTGRLADQLGAGAPSYVDYLKHTSFGAWVAVAGFLLIGIGAVQPARRRR